MADAAEDVEGLPPCVMRGIDVPVVVVDIAKEGERLRLAFGLADFPVQVAGLPVTGNGLVPVAEVSALTTCPSCNASAASTALRRSPFTGRDRP
jgi:hypothetical protein